MNKTITKILLVFFACLLLVLFVHAQEEVSSGQKGFLWKIQSENSVVYLLGSIHLAKKEMYPLAKKIEDAFDESDILVVEVNIDEIDHSEMERLIMDNAFYTEGQTLEEKLSKRTYQLAKRKLKDYGIDIHLFNTRKIWFLALFMQDAEYLKMGFDPSSGIDEYFLKKAKGKKGILELESANYQIKLFDTFSDDLQELLLVQTLADLDMLRTTTNKMINAWAMGDTKVIESILSTTLAEHPETLPIYEKLLYERNRNMTSKIEVYLKTKGKYFVVVGAGHLLGKGSIVELLKEKGYSVEQL